MKLAGSACRQVFSAFLPGGSWHKKSNSASHGAAGAVSAGGLPHDLFKGANKGVGRVKPGLKANVTDAGIGALQKMGGLFHAQAVQVIQKTLALQLGKRAKTTPTLFM